MTVPAIFSKALAALAPSRKLVIAVSGGLDSMALLHLAVAEKRHEIFVAHFNHQLRGPESDHDEQFVREQANAMGLAFHSGSADVRAHAKGISIEMAARQLRHEFLATIAQLHQADVALAHHADDQIELFLMRLLRGIEGPGLAGMRPSSASPSGKPVRLLRPLLQIPRFELESFVKQNKIPFREDSSNAELFADRNRIRHTIIPALREEAAAQFEARMLEHIESIRQQLEFKRESARAWLDAPNNFETLPAWLQQEIIATQLDAFKIPITSARLQKLLKSQAPISIGSAQRISLDSCGRIQIHRPNSDAKLSLNLSRPGEAQFAGVKVSWNSIDSPDISPAKNRIIFDADRIGANVSLRHCQTGDTLRLSGRTSARPLHQMFSRNKIPRAQRNRLLVATTATGEIFWVEGLRITEGFKVTPATKRFLEWRWSRSHL